MMVLHGVMDNRHATSLLYFVLYAGGSLGTSFQTHAFIRLFLFVAFETSKLGQKLLLS